MMIKLTTMCMLSIAITSILSGCGESGGDVSNDHSVNNSLVKNNAVKSSDSANHVFVGNVGVVQNVNTKSVVTLDASANSDSRSNSNSNSDTSTPLWALTEKPKGSKATLKKSTTVSPTFTADVDGSYIIQRLVTDGTVNSVAETVRIFATTAEDIQVKNTVLHKFETLPLANTDTIDTDNDGVVDNLDMDDNVIAHPSNLGASYVIDEQKKFILYNGDDINLMVNHIVGLETIEIDENETSLTKGKGYDITYNDLPFTLYRTELPIIYLNTGNQEILDEPKTAGDLIILENGKQNFESFIGMERRGNSSQYFPKKSYNMELWADPAGNNSAKKKLLDLRKDDDWILDGLWNEPLRLRDFVSHSLWLKIGRYPYSAKKPNITLGIEKKYAEIFLNGEYRGIYYLGEKVDNEQLTLKEYSGGLTGELYKAKHGELGSKFKGVENYSNYSTTWSGYEAKYPNDIGKMDWNNLHGLVNFVVNSDKTTFDATIAERVDLENMADYYIFINMIYARDNWHKNFYVVRYNQNSPYFFVPWDMDGSFGRDWRGDKKNITDKMLSSRLFDKLLLNDKFKTEVKARWNTLKTDELSVIELQKMFKTNHDYLKSNNTYAREDLDAELPFTSHDETEIDFINDWIERRFTYMDAYFESL